MGHAFKAIWKIGKYFLGLLVGAFVSLSVAQQKFPPNLQMLGNLQKVKQDVVAAQQVKQELQKVRVLTPPKQVEAKAPNVEDPFEEALQIHEKQRETWQKVDQAVNGTEPVDAVARQVAAQPTTTTIPPNMKVYKTELKKASQIQNHNVTY